MLRGVSENSLQWRLVVNICNYSMITWCVDRQRVWTSQDRAIEPSDTEWQLLFNVDKRTFLHTVHCLKKQTIYIYIFWNKEQQTNNYTVKTLIRRPYIELITRIEALVETCYNDRSRLITKEYCSKRIKKI